MKILVTGGGGYVGAVLVPALLNLGHEVKVLDLFIYGKEVFDALEDQSALELIEGDIRDQNLLKQVFPGVEVIIHLACISNDPSFELNPDLGKSINLDAFEPLVQIAKSSGVKRFIYASSSSVYGVKSERNVTEDLSLEPLTDYSKFKADCEVILKKYLDDAFCGVIVRPATVCGYSPRQRLDVVVNILSNLAFHKGVIKVMGGEQLRPNIHIQDMVRAYLLFIEADPEKIQGQTFNVGYENHPVKELAEMVKNVVSQEREIDLEVESSDDNRSYHVSSQKILDHLGFAPKHNIQEAVQDLVNAFKDGRLKDPLNNPMYSNIKRMKEIELK